MMKKLIALLTAVSFAFAPVVVEAAPHKPAKKVVKTHKVMHAKPIKKTTTKVKTVKHLPKHGKKIAAKHPAPAPKARHQGPRVAY